MNQAVFDHFRSVQFSSAHACAEMTGVPPAEVTAAMREMQRTGYLQAVSECDGLYRYSTGISSARLCKQPPQVPVPQLQQKLWWAISMPHNSPAPFTAFSIAQLAGCSVDYATKYITGLLLRKLVRRIGRSGQRVLWQRAAAAPSANEPPRVNIQQGE